MLNGWSSSRERENRNVDYNVPPTVVHWQSSVGVGDKSGAEQYNSYLALRSTLLAHMIIQGKVETFPISITNYTDNN